MVFPNSETRDVEVLFESNFRSIQLLYSNTDSSRSLPVAKAYHKVNNMLTIVSLATWHHCSSKTNYESKIAKLCVNSASPNLPYYLALYVDRIYFKLKSLLAVPENIHTHPKDGHWKF